MFPPLIILVLSCVANSAVPVDRVDVVYPSVETSESGEKRVKFRELDLNLEPAGEVIADGFTITDAKTGIKHGSADVKKKLFRNKEKGAALHIDEDGPLKINGFIDSKSKIRPCKSSEKFIQDGGRAHCITKQSEGDGGRFNDAIISPSLKRLQSSHSLMKMRDDQCVIMDYLFVTESNFTYRFNNTEDMKVYLSITMTGVQNLMDTLNLRIKVRLIGIIPFTEENEPSFIRESQISGHEKILHANHLVQNMMKHYCEHKDEEELKHSDIIMLITRRVLGNPNPDGTIFTGILGVANLGGACDPCGKCGVVADLDDYLDRTNTIAHESAHLVGSPHDGEGPEFSLPGSPAAEKCSGKEGFIMGDNYGENKKKFSNCSRENIKYFLNLPMAECIIQDCKNDDD